ncbi:trans-sialidase [Trypanosoma cruzi]|nr:trans-sialidase [Trypanosoma cruzi]
MLLLQLVLAAASLRGHEEKVGGGGESAPWLSSSVEMLHGVWRYCSEMPHHHARGRGTEWEIFFFVSAAVGVGAFASELSTRWLQRVAVTLFSRRTCCHFFTCVLLRGQCAGGCAVAGWRERSRGNCVSAAVKGRAGCLAAEGIALPAQHRSCRASSITPQHRSRRHQHAARQRMPPPPRVRPEGDTSAVAF